jgi:hypothetical protein
MSVDLELATIGQIAEELKKRRDIFVLISCKTPKTQDGDTLNVGMMSYGHPVMLTALLQQAAAIISGMPPDMEP